MEVIYNVVFLQILQTREIYKLFFSVVDKNCFWKILYVRIIKDCMEITNLTHCNVYQNIQYQFWIIFHIYSSLKMENNQATIELETEPPKADTTNLPDDEAQNPVDGYEYQTIH